jgi:hypothetical protein
MIEVEAFCIEYNHHVRFTVGQHNNVSRQRFNLFREKSHTSILLPGTVSFGTTRRSRPSEGPCIIIIIIIVVVVKGAEARDDSQTRLLSERVCTCNVHGEKFEYEPRLVNHFFFVSGFISLRFFSPSERSTGQTYESKSCQRPSGGAVCT